MRAKEDAIAPEEFGFKSFSDNPFYREQNAHLIDMTGVAPGQRIIDLACGTGGVTQLIVERLKGARDSVVIGIDQSAASLRQAVEDLKDARDAAVQFVQSQVEQVSEAVKESVDTVFYCNAIHYVPDKDALLASISKTVKPGGKLAFNTSFFEGAHLPETLLFYRKWMLRAARSLRREYGLSPVRAEKVEARKHLTPDEYRGLVEGHGFRVTKQEIETVQVPLEGWLDISGFEDFIAGVMPGVPLDKASAVLKAGVIETFRQLGVDYVPRNWLDVVAVRV
jgi:ubiquinone/menaquinone biosynthesis C-methylase UbiE